MATSLDRSPTEMTLLQFAECDVLEAHRTDAVKRLKSASDKMQALHRMRSGSAGLGAAVVTTVPPVMMTAAGGGRGGMSDMATAVLFAVVLALGLALNISNELITRIDQRACTLVSVCQYVFIITRAVLFDRPWAKDNASSSFGARLRFYAFITAAGTGSTILLNQSVQIGGPSFFPILLTMCSGQIVLIMAANLSMTGARYSVGEVLGAVIMSAGMGMAVHAKMQAAASSAAAAATSWTAWATGSPVPSSEGDLTLAAGVLLLGLFVLGLQKVLQEKAFDRFGKVGTVGEMVFWTHVLGLPLLLTEYAAVLEVSSRWWAMPAVELGSYARLPPLPWLLLLFNILCNAAATSALLRLVSATNSLVASLDVTLYRFGAILVSALLLNAPPYPPPLMAIGCVLVLGGSLSYLYSAKIAVAKTAAKSA